MPKHNRRNRITGRKGGLGERIIRALNITMWIGDKGWWAEYKDNMGEKMLHEDAESCPERHRHLNTLTMKKTIALLLRPCFILFVNAHRSFY